LSSSLNTFVYIIIPSDYYPGGSIEYFPNTLYMTWIHAIPAIQPEKMNQLERDKVMLLQRRPAGILARA
jgi:hypothetical protein